MGFFELLRQLHERQENLKHRIHNFRMPLSPAGQRFMGFVYFCIPVIGGYYIMQWAQRQAEKNLGKHGEKLRKHLAEEEDLERRRAARDAARFAATVRLEDGGSLDADSFTKMRRAGESAAGKQS
uniref:Uncharacterized protein n=1 Tax=Pinguiococcus pyrenoidosus TaxID=172671 RepID=A0A7R9U3Q2_9STRA|mmetsp:Transcript_12982/g.48127  ORF Transcript_12982/g.48127 Transcript_12982/m.48127 type:complete len:125 (+) Transcript_12982:159-533(+)